MLAFGSDGEMAVSPYSRVIKLRGRRIITECRSEAETATEIPIHESSPAAGFGGESGCQVPCELLSRGTVLVEAAATRTVEPYAGRLMALQSV